MDVTVIVQARSHLDAIRRSVWQVCNHKIVLLAFQNCETEFEHRAVLAGTWCVHSMLVMFFRICQLSFSLRVVMTEPCAFGVQVGFCWLHVGTLLCTNTTVIEQLLASSDCQPTVTYRWEHDLYPLLVCVAHGISA